MKILKEEKHLRFDEPRRRSILTAEGNPVVETGGKKDTSPLVPGGVSWKPIYLVYVVILLFTAGQYFFLRPQTVVPAIEYGVFLDQLGAGAVAEVDIRGSVLQGKFAKPVPLQLAEGAAAEPVTIFTTRLPAFQGETLIGTLREHKVRINIRKPEEESLFWRFVIGTLPWVLIIAVWLLILRRTSKFPW